MSTMTATPDWFQEDAAAIAASEIFKSQDGVSSLLSAARRDMYDAYANFLSNLRNTTAVMFGLLSVAGFVFTFAIRNSGGEDAIQIVLSLKILVAILLISIVPASLLAMNMTIQVFRYYVSTVLYAMVLHEAAGIGQHAWWDFFHNYLEYLENPPSRRTVAARISGWIVRKQSGASPTPRTRLVDSWVSDPSSIYFPFVLLLLLIDILSVAGAISIFLFSGQ